MNKGKEGGVEVGGTLPTKIRYIERKDIQWILHYVLFKKLRNEAAQRLETSSKVSQVPKRISTQPPLYPLPNSTYLGLLRGVPLGVLSSA
jgi:hypothetical protein